jgi:hypothetical protein
MRTLGQVAYEAFRDTRRHHELFERGRGVFTLNGARAYPEDEEWERQTEAIKAYWEQTAIELHIELMQRSAT